MFVDRIQKNKTTTQLLSYGLQKEKIVLYISSPRERSGGQKLVDAIY